MTDAKPLAGRKEWLALGALTLPPLVIAMDLTVLFFAVPSISASLKPTSVEQLWMIDIYGFVLAGMLITMGALGDLIGRRRLLLIGSIVFGLASVSAAFATSPELLIAARAVQGLAGATLMPSALALVRSLFHDEKQRRSAIAVWSTGVAAGTGIGPVISGLLLNNFWWGSIFLVNVPIILVLLVLVVTLVPEAKVPRHLVGKFDLFSSVLSLAAVLTVIWGVKEWATQGYSPIRVGSIGVGVVLAAIFLIRQRRLANPMIDSKLFGYKGFAPVLLLSLFAFFCVLGFGLFSTQYLLEVVGKRPLEAGLWMLVVPVVTGMMAPLAAGLVNKIRPAYVIGGAFLMIAAGFAVMTQLPSDGNLWLVLIGIALIGGGSGAVLVLVTDLIVGIAPPERTGSVYALQRTFQELGGASGIAIFGSIGAAIYTREFDKQLPDAMNATLPPAVHETVGAATSVGAQLPPPDGPALLDIAKVAFTTSLHTSAMVGVGVAVFAALFAAWRLHHISYADQQAAGQAPMASRGPAVKQATARK
ncbi:MFS transporter [Nocardia sp. NBC_01499]|uniref:MFS transporter n=1 Tax=Nocardia sp. NBC_01499 TaxID=2903597 RepID=UPI00386D33D6